MIEYNPRPRGGLKTVFHVGRGGGRKSDEAAPAEGGKGNWGRDFFLPVREEADEEPTKAPNGGDDRRPAQEYKPPVAVPLGADKTGL